MLLIKATEQVNLLSIFYNTQYLVLRENSNYTLGKQRINTKQWKDEEKLETEGGG